MGGEHWSWVPLPHAPKTSLLFSLRSYRDICVPFPFLQFLPQLQPRAWRSYRGTPLCLTKPSPGRWALRADVLEERGSGPGGAGLFTGSALLWGLLMISLSSPSGLRSSLSRLWSVWRYRTVASVGSGGHSTNRLKVLREGVCDTVDWH